MGQQVENNLMVQGAQRRHLLAGLPIHQLVHDLPGVAHLLSEGFPHVLGLGTVYPVAIGANGVEVGFALGCITANSGFARPVDVGIRVELPLTDEHGQIGEVRVGHLSGESVGVVLQHRDDGGSVRAGHAVDADDPAEVRAGRIGAVFTHVVPAMAFLTASGRGSFLLTLGGISGMGVTRSFHADDLVLLVVELAATSRG